MIDISRLTTSDNPHDPIDDYDSWWKFDSEKGYGTPGLVMTIALTSDEFTEEENIRAEERAIDEIMAHMGVYEAFLPEGVHYKKVKHQLKEN